MIIYSSIGEKKLTADLGEGSKRKATLMKEDYIELSFSVADPILLNIGDYIDEDFGYYILTDTYKPTYDTETGGWNYSIQMCAYYWLWKNTIFKYDKETNWNLTAKIDMFLEVLAQSLTDCGYTYKGNPIKFSYDIKLLSKSISLSLSKVNHINALNMIAEALETEWRVIGDTVYFGKVEFGEAVVFSLEENLTNITRSESSGTYANRLYAYGSDKNISPKYRKKLIFSVTDFGVDTIQDASRVLSPSYFKKDNEIPYVMSEYSVQINGSGKNTVDDGNILRSRKTVYAEFENVDGGKSYDVLCDNVVLDVVMAGFFTSVPKTIEASMEIEWTDQNNMRQSKVLYNEVLECEISTPAGTFYPYGSVQATITPVTDIIELPTNVSNVRCKVYFLMGEGSLMGVQYSVTGTIKLKEAISHISSYNTKIQFLTGESAGKTYDAIYNPDMAITEEDANVLKLSENISVEKNDQYIITGIVENNVPYWYFTSDRKDEVATQAIVNRNLCLPLGIPYVQADGITNAEVVEDVITNDEIFPHFLAYVTKVDTENGNLIDEDTNEVIGTYPIYHITTSTEIAKQFSTDYILQGETLKICFSSGSLNGLTFELLGGRDEPYVDEEGLHLAIKRNEDNGRMLPDIYMKPSAETDNGVDENGDVKPLGDEFTLIGYDTSFVDDALVKDAEQRLYEWAKKQLVKQQIDPSTYTCTVMCNKAQEMGVLEIGQKIDLKSKAYFKEGARQSRVIGVEYFLDYTFDNPIYTVGESVAYSRLSEIESKIDNQIVATSNALSGGGISLSTLQSVISSYGKECFVSKVDDDVVNGVLTFLQGLKGAGFTINADGTAQFINLLAQYVSANNVNSEVVNTGVIRANENLTIGDFTKTTGGYFGIDENGNSYIEADKLYIRMKAYFDSLEINRVTYNCGKRIAGAAGVRVAKVEETADAWRCYYLAEQDGVKAQDGFAEDDLCFSETFGVQQGTMSAIGNRRYWRKLVGVSQGTDKDGYRYIDLSKTDCENLQGVMAKPVTLEWEKELPLEWGKEYALDWGTALESWSYDIGGDKPIEGDYVCQLGNKSNTDRQNAIIENVTGSTAPSYTLYKGISNYSLKEKEVFDLGYNVQTKRAYMNMYGDVHIGDRIDSTNAETASFISYSKEEGLHINLGNGKFLVKSKDGKNVMLLGEDNKIKNDFINLDPLTLTSANIPTIGEIEGFAHFGIEPVEASTDSGAVGGDSFTISANAVTELLSIPTNPKTGEAYTSGKLSFSAYSEGVSNYNISKTSENVYVEFVLRINALTGDATYQKINITKNNDYNYSFNVADLSGKKFRIRIEATWKASKSGTSQTAQLTGKATAYIKGYDKTNNLLYSPDLSQVPQQTIVGGNGFLSQGKGVLIHMQSTQEEYEGITQCAGVTFLAGNYGIQITTEGIKQTSNGGIEWNIGNTN